MIWSPGDYFFCREHYRDYIDQSFSIDDHDNTDSPVMTSQGNWLRPNEMDFPEWTDMTCILRMERDRVMLPDNHVSLNCILSLLLTFSHSILILRCSLLYKVDLVQ